MKSKVETLHQMLEEVHERCEDLSIERLPKLLRQEEFTRFFQDFHHEVGGLLQALLADIRFVEETSKEQILGKDDMMVCSSDKVLFELELLFSQGAEKETAKDTALRRTRWIVQKWVEVQIQLLHHLGIGPLAEPKPGLLPPSGDLKKGVHWDFDYIVGIWQRLYFLTVEYLAFRGELLGHCGEKDEGATFNREQRVSLILGRAREAYWKGEVGVSLLLMGALRVVLLRQLGLYPNSRGLPLEQITTLQLLGLAASVQLPFPVPINHFGNLATELDRANGRGEPLDESLLMSAFFIFDDVLRKVADQIPDPEIAKKVHASISVSN